ncbi:RusA family crossover junction endodeoxyribonuclease, partial [Turicibacter sanguinis]|nr:RusA family crossover junction endodeoxyribonuclease [Turicibacter sanguinis]
DNDNIAKSVLDALNGLAYVDDKQIVELKVRKYYGAEPYVHVKLTELEG